jgi:hypothetical protein
MEDKEKFEIANQIYSKLKGANPNIDEIAAEAEKRLGIQLVDNHQIEDLKNKLNPKYFINSDDDSYDDKKVEFAYNLYSRIGDNITYSEYNKLIADAKPILDFWAKKEEEEAQKIKNLKEEREKRETEKKEQKKIEGEKEEKKESTNNFYILIFWGMVLFVLVLVFLGS